VVLPLAFDHLSLDQPKSVRKQGLIEVRVRIPISVGSAVRQQVAIDNDKGTAVTETQQVLPALKADLTWSQLYTKAIHKDLVAISTAITKTRPTTSGPKMKKDAEKLRGQLKSANQTVDELSDDAGLRPAPIKK
jgi:hypothetical protein